MESIRKVSITSGRYGSQESRKTIKLVTQKIHAKELHAKLGHAVEDRINATSNHLHCIVKETLEVSEDRNTEKSNQKLLRKVAKE